MSPKHGSDDHDGWTVDAFQRSWRDNLYYTRGASVQSASKQDLYTALAYTVRDYLIDRWRKTANTYYGNNPKFVYYFCAEYLPGRQLTQNMLYTGTWDMARQALAKEGVLIEDLIALDAEPGLGNGGLGRLAACFLDSLATLDIPSVGYGIRYEYGIFAQSFEAGWQVESPDQWLFYGNPWEFPQPDDALEVGFGGRTEYYVDEEGHGRFRWIPATKVLGEPSHTLVPGYGTNTVSMLRLWRARATHAFDLQLFDVGDYAQAVAQKVESENITKVLYPNDSTFQGQELRLKQQYFFVSCSLRDIIRRFHLRNSDWGEFPNKVAIQLNDTHPVIAIPELMRLLVEEHRLPWDQAWDITRRTFAYACHTLMPEALEKWPVELFGRLLPRHLEIVYEINHHFLQQVQQRFPGDKERVARMSIIEEYPVRRVRMAHLASVGSFSINGVAELHSRLLTERTLRDFHDMWPERFNNKTNGVTPRRFMRLANRRLSALITETIGEGWLTDLDRLCSLEPYVDDEQFRAAWRRVKHDNKADLAATILVKTGVEVSVDSMFDVMVKRLHEYKRQLLKVLHVITLYNRMVADPEVEMVPRTVIFGAKAAPGYTMAKLIIKLINSVAEVVNHDVRVGDRLKVVFLPNFNVTVAERIYPAADLSEQISLAGKEASGTGNMKFALNGAITIGTLDGANIEIRERVGAENFCLFGLTAEQVFARQQAGYQPLDEYNGDPELRLAIDRIALGAFSKDRSLFKPIVDSLLSRDEFMLLADYVSYVACQEQAEQAYRDEERWARMSILNTARCGYFSSDRAIREYCEEIWGVKPVRVPEQGTTDKRRRTMDG